SCDPLPRYYVRFTDRKEELVWEQEAASGEVVTGADMEAGNGVWDCLSGVWARGQPNFGGGEGIRELRRRGKEIWRAREEEEGRDRLVSKRGGNIRTLYKRKVV